MDLDGFDKLDTEQINPCSDGILTAQRALKVFDQWYARTYRSARWMDLIGDYGGNELFIVDGESLVQHVLDDPLLALGREGDCSFQILHAYFILEQAILEFKRRSANFEIIFWESSCHSTIKTGATDFVSSSRLLARIMLFKHLMKIEGISVHVFKDLEDPGWKRYYVLRKPMFVLANDGGFVDKPEKLDKYSAACVLNRRLFLFRLLASGIAFSRLNGAEYREFKILAFVNEQNQDPDACKLLPRNFWKAASRFEEELVDTLSRTCGQIKLTAQLSAKASTETLLIDLARSVKNSSSGGQYTSELLYFFILHCVMLPGLSTGGRARSMHNADALSNLLTKNFLPTVFKRLALLSATVEDCIDVDGRVFASILSFVSENRHDGISDLLSTADYALLQSIWSQLRCPEPNFILFANHLPLENKVTPSVVREHTHDLLPFENTVFDSVLGSVNVTVQNAEDWVSPAKYFNFAQGLPFRDDKHWHNQNLIITRSSGESKPKKRGFYARRRELQRSQKFMQRLQNQAATLTGASGAILRQIVIAPVGTHNGLRSLKDRVKVKVDTKKKEPKLSSADKLRKKVQEEKAAKQEIETQSWWLERLGVMSSMSVTQQATYLKALFQNKRSEEPSVRLEMQLYQLHLEFLQWIDDADRESDVVRDQRTVAIVRLVKDICDGTQLNPIAAKLLKTALQVVGFDEYAAIVEKIETEADKRLSFKPVKLVSSRTKESHYPYMRIQEDLVLWQLRLFGQFMDRSMDGSPDRRVSFIPDAWQKRVLDSIDSNHSLLVVAPTSAGKTFISFYAMERVLRESDDGILVYVAPTKALVTQVAAEIYARFSKTVANGSCWAIHTRDYRIHDPLHCQILVTVPEILVTMLLSPVMARNWTSRIKWIVLDEIHCIGQQEGGAVWEQIILFATCPIIGLSATVGSPEIFNTWLKSVQEAHGFKHTFVQHPYRYSHLRKFYYLLDKKRKADSFTGLNDYQPTSSTRFLHPISMMSFGTQSMPSDLALEAQDTLTLYWALVRHSKLLGLDIDVLEPRRFFAESKGKLLTQKDIIRYEAALKDVLSPIFATFDPTDSSSPLHYVLNDLKDTTIATVPASSLNATPSSQVFLNNLIYLISDLHANDSLPAILFSFDRTGCEIALSSLLKTLEVAESEWKETSPEWNRKIRAWEAWQATAKARERQADRESKNKREDDPGLHDEGTSWQSSFDPDEPIGQFSFSNPRAYSKVELKKDIAELSGLVQPRILLALKRGIAVHHSGMNKGYRALVESLFRQRFIRVLISTGTLALGINAPAKTCVFLGDSPYLTALMFRQCSGRAGRRGYDLLGNVIFYGLTMNRVERLVLSKLPTLGGNFPVTSTLVLRLCNLLHGSNNAHVAVNAIQTIASLPSVCFGSEVGRDQILHHLRFSIEYLRRSHLLDMQGRPINLYAIAAHLYYTEPSNLALIALMHSGVLHKICARGNTEDAKRAYIHLMSHLFGRRYISRITMNSETMSNLIRTYPSMVVLKPLSKNICESLNQHGQNVLDIFVAYAMAYSKEHETRLGPGDSLPLSGIRFGGASDGAQSRLNQYLEGTATKVTARSIFVANSGHDDQFNTVSELARTVRQGVYLNEHAIPSMTHLVTGRKEYDLNAYLLDFYTHGQTASLIKANGIRSNDVWYLLEDFALTLASMKAALEQLFTMNAKAMYEREKEENTLANSTKRVNQWDKADGDTSDEFELETLSLTGDQDDFEDEEPGDAEYYLMKRPIGVSKADWKVYDVVSAAREEFMVKFKATWA